MSDVSFGGFELSTLKGQIVFLIAVIQNASFNV